MKSLSYAVVVGLPWNRSIVKTVHPNSPPRFRVKQGDLYICKLVDGGYTTKSAAIQAAKRTLP